MENATKRFRQLKPKIDSMRINRCWFRHPLGMSATILQWFALDLEPPSCGRVKCNTALGEKPFYN
ncbi:MAG: hypothetical protein HUU08_10825 [Candidatus Brocadia sp.]|nr:hypothetical protein [Candidatus Brocadia sp.]